MASPLIPALRKKYPEAKLVWMLQSDMASLLQNHPLLDEVIVWPRREWRELRKQGKWLHWIREVIAKIRELRSYHFDLALDPQGLMKSAIWARASGAKRRIGVNSREGSRLLMTEVIDGKKNIQRISSEYLALAEYLQLPVDTFPMSVPVQRHTMEAAHKILQQHAVGESFITFCPFTTRPQKHWFEENWIKLAEQLQHRFSLPMVILGGPADREAAQRMCDRVDSANLINFAGATSIPEAVAILSLANLTIGVDTGLTHLSIAQDTPTLCLFGSTVPYLDTATDHAKVLYHPRDCSPCKRNPSCDGRFDCMRAITANEVVQHSVEFLDQ